MFHNRRERGAHAAYLTFRETGSPDAMARVFDLVAPQLHRLGTRLVGDATAADDLVQGTFLDAIAKVQRFDDTRPLIPWMTGILVNHARHEWRRQQRHPSAARVEPVAERSGADAMLAAEVSDAVRSGVSRVPEAYREVLGLRLHEGLGPTEIAGRLLRPVETVRTQLKRGMIRLRAALPQGIAPALLPAWMRPDFVSRGGSGLSSVRESVCEAAARAPCDSRSVAAEFVSSRRASLRPFAPWTVATGVLLCAGTVSTVILVEDRGSNSAAAPVAVRAAVSAGERSVGIETVRAHHREPVAVDANAAGLVRVTWTSTGAPAEHVTVALRPAGDRSWLREVRAVTDAEGVASFGSARHRSTSNRWDIRTVPGAAGVRTYTSVDLRRGLELNLPRATSVSGTVVDDRGAPVSGARIWVAATGLRLDDGACVASTDAQGRYQVFGVTAGSALGALADGWAPAGCVAVRPAAGVAEFSFGFVLTQRTAPVDGLVVDTRGRPVRSAAVVIGRTVDVHDLRVFGGEAGLGAPTRLRTDRRGRFRCLDQAPAEVSVWIGAPGYAPVRLLATSSRGGTRSELLARLRAGVTVRGTVSYRLASGGRKPVEAATLRLDHDAFMSIEGPGWSWCETVTSARGSFEIGPLPRGAATLVVSNTDDGGVTRSQRVLSDTGTWDVMLESTFDVAGRLTGPDGAALVGWWVDCSELTTDHSKALQRTNAEGGFVAAGLRVGSSVRFRVQDPEVPGDGAPVERVVLIERGVSLDLRLTAAELPTSALRLRVQDHEGRSVGPVTGMLRRFERDGSVVTFSVAGRAIGGRQVVFAGLRSGRYELGVLASASGTLRSAGVFDLAAGATLDAPPCVFEPSATILVRAQESDGLPLDAVDLLVQPIGGTYRFGIRLADGVGELELQPGGYRVAYLGPRGMPFVREVELRAGATTTIDVHLQAGVARWYRLTGIPRRFFSATIEWFDDAGQRIYSMTARLHPHHDAPNQVVLPSGEYLVRVTDGLGRVVETRLELAPETGRELGDPLEIAVGR